MRSTPICTAHRHCCMHGRPHTRAYIHPLHRHRTGKVASYIMMMENNSNHPRIHRCTAAARRHRSPRRMARLAARRRIPSSPPKLTITVIQRVWDSQGPVDLPTPPLASACLRQRSQEPAPRSAAAITQLLKACPACTAAGSFCSRPIHMHARAHRTRSSPGASCWPARSTYVGPERARRTRIELCMYVLLVLITAPREKIK